MGLNRKQVDSPSKRLRNVYFLLWEKDSQGFKEFDDFYDSKMEKLISYFKKML
mgnify:CR=1 FL=1